LWRARRKRQRRNVWADAADGGLLRVLQAGAGPAKTGGSPFSLNGSPW
jgi:hypothetical protein